ncbi:hypothetical protein ACFL2E_05045 [Thermodesulfobacteriota bacterium]
MTIVDIKGFGKEGQIEFDDSNPVKYSVIFPDEKIREQIIQYLNTPQEYRIPESQRIDDFRIDWAKPTDDMMYFDLALCTLHNELGLWVAWK